MKRRLIIMAMTMAAIATQAQTTLEQCRQMARDNYPAIKQYGLIEQSRDFTVANAAKGFLPQVSATANAIYMTDIMKMPSGAQAQALDIKNNVYSVMVQVNQKIYDGGNIAAQKMVARAQADVNSSQLNVTMYDINQRIDQLFFGILTLDEQLRQNALLKSDLALSRKTVNAMMKGGIANQSDVDAVNVQQIKCEQNETTLMASRRAFVRMLSTFTGSSFTDSSTFTRPEYMDAGLEINRPELNYYTAQSALLNAQRKQLDSQLMPQLSAFGIGMYHNKIITTSKNNLFTIGATLSWNIGALYTRKNDIRKLNTQRDVIETNRTTFMFNTKLQNESTNGEIDKLKKEIALDDDIIRLYQNIRDKSEKKVQNGTETVNEMLRDINAVSEAKQGKALHELQLLKKIYELKNINNN